MPEEANEEVQEEEITLTEDDLAVIDEVEATEDESHEIEQSDSVDSEPEPVVDDEPSIDNDPSGQTFNPDLVNRASQYGLDPASVTAPIPPITPRDPARCKASVEVAIDLFISSSCRCRTSLCLA